MPPDAVPSAQWITTAAEQAMIARGRHAAGLRAVCFALLAVAAAIRERG